LNGIPRAFAGLVGISQRHIDEFVGCFRRGIKEFFGRGDQIDGYFFIGAANCHLVGQAQVSFRCVKKNLPAELPNQSPPLHRHGKSPPHRAKETEAH